MTMGKVLYYTLVDLARNRSVLAFAALLFVVAEGLFLVEGEAIKAVLSLVQVVLALVPLVALVFTVVYTYGAQEFTQLLAVQPIGRSAILGGRMLALGLSFLVALLFGLGLPLTVHAPGATSLVLLVAAVLLAWVFLALGTLIALVNRDRARGVGTALAAWAGAVLVYDALLMTLLFAFSDRPVEPFVLPVAALNPIDLARIAVTIQVDLAAMMGYSGAVYKKFLGSGPGIATALAFMLLWVAWPTVLSFRVFRSKDL